ncbi:nuclear transport factor 2 family protein [Solirubrobacter sp. CPCC 204708]|uniref:Nuclear transport factor 2 family protein n=1 Tax=Solirubrobacter deserti TaxID=2282478 RepID=A0ABT4REV5_9ACTN|nr:nuclear transport factor 2 family protein [Solirubrobacter deserti]MBE2318616.1 nuclear transport factor 2 family protein [Solirubrobacter deserti]MDA0137074.1 nuclear transport factor 2 family protein [Solirubrobacter deserti]
MSATDQFIDALGRLESERDLEPLVELFADDCTLQNVTVGEDHHGKDGARGFWQDDRKLFDEVRSEFRNVIVDGDRAALEWTRHGTARDGGSVEYAGVSVMEFGDGGIARFMAYFHPRELGRQTTQ